MTEKEKPKLKPAEENPWYVLATICDKWDEDDKALKVGEVTLKNYMVWNSWIVYQHAIENEETLGNKFEWRSENKQTVDSISERRSRLSYGPLWSDIQNEVLERFKKRLPETKFPDSMMPVLLDKIEVGCKLDLQSFIFPKTVFFEDSLFHGGIDLSTATFFSVANFDNVRCSGECNFLNAYFASEAYFKNSTFEGPGVAIFLNVIFGRNSSFYGASFFVPSSFSDCEFRMPCDFNNVQFRENYPLLFNTIFREKITLSAKQNTDTEIYWPNPKNYKGPLEEAKATCEILREQMEAQGLHEQAHFFFRREMHFAGKMLSPWQRLPNQLFACLSAYGFSLKRPLRALGILWFFPALIYAFWLICLGCVDCTGSLQTCVAQQSACQSSALQSALTGSGLSLSNILQFTGLQRAYFGYSYISCLPSWLKFLGGAQTLLAIPLLFLLLLGLRNRFRLK